MLHNVQNNSNQLTSWGGRARAPHICYAVLAEQTVLSTCHRYIELTLGNPVLPDAAVPRHADYVPRHKPTLGIAVVTKGSEP